MANFGPLLLVIALLVQQATAFSTTPANPTTKPQTSPDSNEKQCDVGIVGSGPAGLVLAHALMDRGYSVHILERRSTFRPVGAALFMHPFALNSLKSISPRVEENLREACTPIRSISMSSIVDDDFGFGTDRLDEAPDVFGSPFVAVRFWDMLQALRKGLPDDIFRFGHEIQSFEQLEDGVRLHYDVIGEQEREAGSYKVGMLIDAGGIRSNIRKQLIGDKPIPRCRATFAVASAGKVEKTIGTGVNGDRKVSFVMGDEVSVTTASLKNGDVWWTQTRYGDDPVAPIPTEEEETLQERLDERFAVWPSNIKGLVAATEYDEILEYTIAELPVTLKWGKGGVTLLGDAAHAQLPALGLGVSTAFADVDELCRQIDKFGLSQKALRWYEFVRIPLTACLQLLSRLAYVVNLYISQTCVADEW